MVIINNTFDKKIFRLIVLFLVIVTQVSCNSNDNLITENYIDFSDGNWNHKKKAEFEFEIKDINSDYSLFYNIRNTLSYEFYNIYVKYEIINESGKLIRSNMHQANLMEPKTGKPYGNPKPLGNAAANVYTSQIPVLEKIQFTEPGKYTFSIRHYMRNEKLDGILGVGLTVKKIIQQ